MEDNPKANCATQNKPGSFSGVMLQGRKLMPSAYSFTNTNMWQMTSWQLQASSDMKKWVILDKRVVEPSEALSGVQCWAIREDTAETYPEGFSAFRVVQNAMNTKGTHNLSITQFEIFGEPTNPELWYF